jgi:polyhydroxybutyrate depolymerase
VRKITQHHLRLLCAIAAAMTLWTKPADAQRGVRVALTHQGRIREYLLHVPASTRGALVLVFHGGGQTAAQQQEISGFDALADREQFIVAYPDAVEKVWRDGRDLLGLGLGINERDVDDVGFAKAVVADIAKTHAFDRARVFATGFSNGGILANRLGCEAADTFAAIAPVAGTPAKSLVASCHPSAPVGVVGIHGVADPSVPFAGNSQVEGSRATQELWRTLNGCSARVTTASLPTIVRDDTAVDRRAYQGCRGNADVVWYEIQGGGHRWPPHHEEGLRETLALRENGVSSRNINASEVIWSFFAAHPRR